MGHPYTCANRGDGHHGEEGGDLGVLIATPDGWVCPHCDYVQMTAHPAMAQGARPSKERTFGQYTDEQLLQVISRHIQAYKKLEAEKPSARGVRVMINSLQLRSETIVQALKVEFERITALAHPQE